jgi:hypothetical protein
MRRKKKKKRRKRKAAMKTMTMTTERMTRKTPTKTTFYLTLSRFISLQCCLLIAEPLTNAPVDHPRPKTSAVYSLHWTDLPYAMTIVLRTAT